MSIHSGTSYQALVVKEPNGQFFFRVFHEGFWKDFNMTSKDFDHMILIAMATTGKMNMEKSNAEKSKKETRNVSRGSKKIRKSSARRTA